MNIHLKYYFPFLVLIFLTSLVKAQSVSNTSYWVANLNKSYNKDFLIKVVKDSLRKCLQDNYLPLRFQKEDIDKLSYLYFFCAKIKSEVKEFTDTSSIYPYIMIDTTRLPFDVFLSKRNGNYWGRIHFDKGFSFLEQVSELDKHSRQKLSDLSRFIINQSPNIVFYVDNFGDFIWYTRADKIMIYRRTWKDITEADVFIHQFYNKEAIRKIAE